jgi:hypothetical protein
MRFVSISLALLMLALVAGCRGENRVDVVVEEQRLARRLSGAAELSGTLVNRGSEALPSVQVQVALYNADNVRVDRTFFVARDLAPGEPVHFREILDSEADVHRARVEGVFRL